MIPDLAGRTLEVIRHNYVLMLWTDNNWEIDLEGRTFLRRTGADPVEIDTTLFQEELSEEVKPLLGATISAITTTERGDLLVTMDGMELRVEAGRDHEAWQVYGPDGEMYVCMPGGELAIWDAQPRQPAAPAAPVVPDFAGETIVRIRLGTALEVLLSNDWQLTLGGEWFVTRAGQPPQQVPKSTERLDPPPQLSFLVGARITSIVVAPEGQLALNVDGAQLSLRPVPSADSWQLHGPNGELVVCGATGEITSQGPRPS